MPRLKLIEMDSFNKMIYFRKDDKLIAFDADVAIGLISDSLDGNNVGVVRCKDCKYRNDVANCERFSGERYVQANSYCSWGERREDADK